ncbi:MAG: hypothetical protein R3C05_23715 [Pirellulaceae bacterium]
MVERSAAFVPPGRPPNVHGLWTMFVDRYAYNQVIQVGRFAFVRNRFSGTDKRPFHVALRHPQRLRCKRLAGAKGADADRFGCVSMVTLYESFVMTLSHSHG